jgi:hypothetical protein
LNTDVNVPSKSNKQKISEKDKAFVENFSATHKKSESGAGAKFGSDSESGPISQWYRSADPDPYQNVPDPQHC